MKVVICRSKNSNVIINNEIYNSIPKGLVVLSCFENNDTIEDILYIVKKIVNLRIFDDDNHIMNKSIMDIKGRIYLLVSLLYMLILKRVIDLVMKEH